MSKYAKVKCYEIILTTGNIDLLLCSLKKYEGDLYLHKIDLLEKHEKIPDWVKREMEDIKILREYLMRYRYYNELDELFSKMEER